MTDVFEANGGNNPRQQGLQQVVAVAVVDALIALATHPATSPAVAARVEWMLTELRTMMQRKKANNDMGRGHQARLAAEIGRYLDRAQEGQRWRGAMQPPPGSPIGADQVTRSRSGTGAGVALPEWSLMDCSWGVPR
jgi:hypothetical protein